MSLCDKGQEEGEFGGTRRYSGFDVVIDEERGGLA